MQIKFLLLFFILLHISSLIYWNTAPTNPELLPGYDIIKYVVEPVGLWQNWNVFAPPPQAEAYIAIIGISDNLVINYTPNYQENAFFLSNEKERKWNENILNDDYSHFRTAYLEYRCRKFELDFDHDFTEVILREDIVNIPPLNSNLRVRQFSRKWSIDC